MTLGEYLRAPRGAWWKNTDCCRWVAGWAIAAGRPDPIAFVRGRYATQLGALRLMNRCGGLLRVWERGAEDAGLEAITAPELGCIAVLAIETDDGTGQCCGIWTGQRWATLHLRGLLFGPGRPIKMWRI